jgi:excinuclease ABC subunit C
MISHKLLEEKLIVDALRQKHETLLRFEVPKFGLKADLMNHVLKNATDAIDRKVTDAENLQAFFEGLKSLFDLPSIPERIEVYDNSHLQGTNACGVMIVATPNGFDKKSYRKFLPKEAKSNDDFGMMREFLKRRLKRKDEWPLPDLLLIDGGAGQLSSVEAIITELNLEVPVVGIAKGPDRNAGREKFFMKDKAPFGLPHNDPFLHFLQRLRDEAHRFVIGMHRQKRQKLMTQSSLDAIPGIGAARKKKLLHHFGSAKNVAGAGIADLERVDGINRFIAQKIYEFFHG